LGKDAVETEEAASEEAEPLGLPRIKTDEL
jgi:hypothetical protein